MLLLLVLITVLLFFASLFTGTVHIPAADVIHILSGGTEVPTAWNYIIEDRLSRSLMAIAAGGGLSLAGLVMQTLFRNPLAGPGVMGVSAGAGAGAAFVLMFPVLAGITGVLIPAGIIGAAAVLIIILWASRVFSDPSRVLVTGMMLTFFTSAMVSVMFQYAPAQGMQRYIIWGLGSLGGLQLNEAYLIMSCVLLLSLSTLFFSKHLDLLLLGDVQAELSGLNVLITRRITLMLSGVLTAIITVYCGPIGFVGLAVPQLVKLTGKSGLHHQWIPKTIVAGMAFMLICDIFTRIPVLLPLNAVTSIAGAPVVVWILYRYRYNQNATV